MASLSDPPTYADSFSIPGTSGMSKPAPPMPSPPITATASGTKQDLTRFELLVKKRELRRDVAHDLLEVLSTCEVVLLCDDSDSMGNAIAEEGTDPFAPKRSTRWLELKKLASVIIEVVTATNTDGLDIYFLNREKRCKVNTPAGLQVAFNAPPDGSTPLISTLQQIYNDKISMISHERQLLIVVITDGEPTDGSRGDLYNMLTYITSGGNVHVSFAECTDNAEDMEYLDAWDGCIRNFDNTDDYREELNRVKSLQGVQFKFDYMDYVVKILLATFRRWYFNLDQVRVAGATSYAMQSQVQFQPPATATRSTSSTMSTMSTMNYSQPVAASYRPVAMSPVTATPVMATPVATTGGSLVPVSLAPVSTQPQRYAPPPQTPPSCCIIL